MLTRTLLTWSLQVALMSTMFTIHAEVAQIQSFCPQAIYIWFFNIRSGSLVCNSYPISSNAAAVRMIRSVFMWGFFLCLTSVCIDLPSSVSKHTSPSSKDKHGHHLCLWWWIERWENVDNLLKKKSHILEVFFLRNLPIVFIHCIGLAHPQMLPPPLAPFTLFLSYSTFSVCPYCPSCCQIKHTLQAYIRAKGDVVEHCGKYFSAYTPNNHKAKKLK